MSQILVKPSPDIVRLIRDGYEVEIRGAFLLVSHVPYVTSKKDVSYGTLVSKLALNGNEIGSPDTHVVHFAGEHPCHRDGRRMTEIQHSSSIVTLGENIVVHHSFSNKPRGGYSDYYEKMTRYVKMISTPAISIEPSATAKTHRHIPSESSESVFNYLDTNSTRAEIGGISAKFRGQKVGIIGIGGTGAYILDLVAKTPVDEIHLFDGDVFCQHNAFRAPGAPTQELLKSPPLKVEYFAEIYEKMRCGIFCHPHFLDVANIELLSGLDFVFICMDKGRLKAEIATFLESTNVSFIDAGIGVHIADGNLISTIRTTTSTPENREAFRKHVSFTDAEDGEYATNIQIADLNMLNAAQAVIRWKKIVGFYQDFEQDHHTTYSTNINQFLSE